MKIKFFRYLSHLEILYLIIFLLNFLCFGFSSYKAFSIPKIDKNVVVLYKTSGTDKEGKVNYFADVQDSSKKIWTEAIKFGFEYDSLKIGDNIVVKNFQTSALIFCGFAFLNLMIGFIMRSGVFKILTGED